MSDDIFENIKKLKLFGEELIAFSNNKIIFKDLKNPEDHLTMLMTKDGRLDFHNKKEGPSPEYESLGEFDLTKIQDPQFAQELQTRLLQMVKVVNFTEPEFENCIIAIFPTREDFSKVANRKKYNVTIDLDAAKKGFQRRIPHSLERR